MPSSANRHPGGRILIIDDNSHGLAARKGVLAEYGHEIVTTSDPQEALHLCVKQKFDLVVTDFKMPLMDGREFIRQLREQNGAVPVILLSGFTDTLGLSEQNTGADAVLQKSSNEVAHLVRAVNRLLKKTTIRTKSPPPTGPGTPKKPAASEPAANQDLKKWGGTS